MKHREQILGLLLAAFALVSFFPAGSAWGQAVYSSWAQEVPAAFVVAPFVDAHTGNGDTSLLITNTGVSYDLCADVYLFNPDGKMLACCACPVKENGLLTMSINDLTKNPVTGVPPTTGVFKVVSSTICEPANPILYPGLKIYQRSVSNTSSVPSSVVVAVPDTPLGMFEFQALKRGCAAIQQSGGGLGICSCPVNPVVGNPG